MIVYRAKRDVASTLARRFKHGPIRNRPESPGKARKKKAHGKRMQLRRRDDH